MRLPPQKIDTANNRMHRRARAACGMTGAAAVGLACSAASGAGCLAEEIFHEPNLGQGDGPSSIVVSDLDGDGHPDLVLTNRTFGRGVSVLLNDGDGGFAPPQTYRAGVQPSGARVGDFDGDGAPDIAAVDVAGNSIVLLRNLGDAVFTPNGTLPFPDSPTIGGIADLNGDGSLDILANWVNDEGDLVMGALLGNGAGAFTIGPVMPVAERADLLVDVNGDGAPDVISSSFGGASVRLGVGDGSFSPASALPVGVAPLGQSAGDVNSDGAVDLVFSSFSDPVVEVLLGAGDGTFAAAPPVNVGGLALGPVLADVDGDGALDLITTLSGEDAISIFSGAGDGTFAPAQSVTAEEGASAMAAADLNGDGAADIASANNIANSVSVALNNGAGSFPDATAFAAGPEAITQEIIGPVRNRAVTMLASGDVDGDGIIDAVTRTAPNGLDTALSFLRGMGDGSFAPPMKVDYTAKYNPLTIGLADLNSDGRADLVIGLTTPESVGRVRVRQSNGDGAFGAATEFMIGTSPQDLVFGDFNGDGATDIMAIGGQTGAADYSVLLGDGNGGFTVNDSVSVGRNYVDASVGDVNGDGIPDVAALAHSAQEIDLLIGLGDGTFATSSTLVMSGPGQDVAIGDVNDDGIADIVVGRASDDIAAEVFFGAGGGSFGAATMLGPYIDPDGSTSLSSGAIAIVDVTNDGLADIVQAGGGNSLARVIPGSAGGGFEAPWFASFQGIGLLASDLNGDGSVDLATLARAEQGPGRLVSLINQCAATAACSGDLTGDGVVGTSDLAGLLGAWGSDSDAADLNEDGVVNAFDLAKLLGAWGGCR